MIIDDYIAYTKEYKSKYGEKCLVLMQVGSFFELYSIVDDTAEDIYTVADLCNIQVSRKNKTINEVSINNPLMAGFPLYTLKKFTSILLNNNYTIVLVEQVTEPPNPERKITEVLSPGMNMNVVSKKNNYMMVIYYEFIDELPVVGISGIDLTTGSSFVYETGSTKTDPDITNDEVFRFITIYNPCEIIILSDKKYTDSKKSYLIKNLNISNILTHYKWENFEHMMTVRKLSYQTAILEKAYSYKKNMLSIIETLNLEKYEYGRIAHCCLLQFAYEHNMDIIKKLNIPNVINDYKYLNIEYNSAVQLNIIGLNDYDTPLLSILNRCMTSFGARVFKERLLKPIIDKEKLNKRYDEIDYLLENRKFETVSKNLSKILDLERIKRKMFVNKMNPQDWYGFDVSINNAIEILEKYYMRTSKVEKIDEYKEMRAFYSDILELNEASKYNINDIKGNIFKVGIYTDIDDYVKLYQEAYDKIVKICERINNLDIGDSTNCKIEYTDREGYYLCMTKKRYETAKSKDFNFMKEFTVKALGVSNNVKLSNNIINNVSNTIEETKNNISKKVTIYYSDFVASFIDKFCDCLASLILTIIEIDISCCNAKNAFEYRYYRPEIIENQSSFVEVENIRHPIIERIDNDIEYIGNDIKLSNCKSNGILLYGINASGKSSLMKSIGLCIVMAQAGMFVSSNKMKYYPYKHLFTRISGMDNIYKGMSSFTVEMTELRNILQRCDKYSLVLGDEICSGTEATSALAIVAAGIDSLVNKQSSFIFATHLHELTELEIVKSHMKEYICVKHIHITIDENNNIVYERKIRDGQGESTYGIEVCKSLDMPVEFMKLAENIRKEVQGCSRYIINPSSSRYCKELYMSECYICKKLAEDTHHINYQSCSNEEGFFQEYHKDIKHNLVPLCKECHQKEHNGDIKIIGYKKTSNGKILDVQKNVKLTTNNHVIAEIDIEKATQYIKKGRNDWYIRTSRNNIFKKCTNQQTIIDKLNKLLKTNLNMDELETDSNIYKKLYDPMF